MITSLFTLQCRKMVRHTLKVLQQVSNHFTTLRNKGLKNVLKLNFSGKGDITM